MSPADRTPEAGEKQWFGRKCPTRGPDRPDWSLYCGCRRMPPSSLGHEGQSSKGCPMHWGSVHPQTCGQLAKGPAAATQGADTWHMPDSWARLVGKVRWQVAEPWCQDPAPSVLRGLSCHMPVSVPAVELQMGRGGWLAQGGAGSHSGEGGRCRPWELFLETEGWSGPGGVPAFSHVPAGPPASRPLIPLCSPPNSPPLWC